MNILTDPTPTAPLAGLSPAQLRRYRAARSDKDSEAAALLLATRHRPLYVDLCRLADRHKPDAQTWGAWLRDAHDATTSEEPERFRAALDVVLTTPHVRSPWALLRACMTDRRTNTPRAQDGGLEDSLRERYPEAFA